MHDLKSQFTVPVRLTASSPHCPPLCGQCLLVIMYQQPFIHEPMTKRGPRLPRPCELPVAKVFPFNPVQVRDNRCTQDLHIAPTAGVQTHTMRTRGWEW